MTTSNNALVGHALAELARGLEPFVADALRPHLHPGMSWTVLLQRRDESGGRPAGIYSDNDLLVILRTMTEALGDLGRPFDASLGRTGIRLAGELRDVRNAWAHNSSFDDDDAFRAVDSAQRLLTIAGAASIAAELGRARRELQVRIASTETSTGDDVGTLDASELEGTDGRAVPAPDIALAPPPQVPPMARTSMTGLGQGEERPTPSVLPPVVPSSPVDAAVASGTAGIEVSISCSPVISYAMAHNGLTVISDVTLTSRDVTARGARLLVGIESAQGPVGPPQEYFVDVVAGSETLVPRLDIKVDPAVMLTVEEARPAKVVVTLVHDDRELGRGVVEVLLLAANQWLARPTLMSLEMLAAHVQPNHPALESLVAEAADELQHATGSGALVGYQHGPERVDATVDAVMTAMRRRRIRYSVPPASWSDQGQKVRTPDEVLVGRVGTCLDTTVTLAAALERVGIRSMLVVVEGHAFLAYWRDETSLASPATTSAFALPNLVRTQYAQVIETTMLTEDFADASSEEVTRAPLQQHLTGDLETVIGITDVHQARTSRIYPLPARVTDADGATVVVTYEAVHSRPAAYAPEARTETAEVGGALEAPARVQRWKNALLDLSLRNRLINFADRARFPLHVAEEGLAEFEDHLNSGKAIELLPSDALPAVEIQRGTRWGRDLPDEVRSDLFHDRRQLYTDASTDSYSRVLRALAYKAKTVLDETGANNLYISIGSLVWKIKDRTVRSPLILVPATLKAKGKAGGYQVVLDDAGASTPNYCLLEKLRGEYGLNVPALADPAMDSSGIDMERVLTETRVAVLESGIEAHVEPTVDLAILQFAKFRLWKDLDENWEALASNALVRHLIEAPTDPFADATATGPHAPDQEAPDLDDLLTRLPLSADSSQAAAVAAATRGQTFVLEGPPGTGKSQTITNLLAEAVRNGKKVLFVAEKRAALDVVHRRLDSVGLAPFTLDLHDKGSKPAPLRAHLHGSLGLRAAADAQAMRRASTALEPSRRRLARYADQVHDRNASGNSLYSAHIAELLHAEAPFELVVPEHVVSTSSEADLDEIRTALQELTDHAGRARPSAAHAWSFVDLDAGDPVDEGALLTAAADLDAALGDVTADPLTAPLREHLTNAEELSFLTAIVNSPGIPLDVLRESRTSTWRGEAQRLTSDLDGLSTAFGDVLTVVDPGIVTLDVDRIAHEAAAAHSSSFFGRKKRRRAVAAAFGHVTKSGVTVDLVGLPPLTARFVALRDAVRDLAARIGATPGLSVTAGWNPLVEEHREYIRAQVAWLSWASSVTDPEGGLAEARGFREALERLTTSRREAAPESAARVDRLRAALSTMTAAPGTTLAAWESWRSGAPLLARWIETQPGRDPLRAHGVDLADWVRWRRAVAPLRSAGLEDAYHAVVTGAVPADEATDAFERGLASASRRERTRSTGLDDFDAVAHRRSIERYTSAADEIRGELPRALPAHLVGRRTFDQQTAQGRAGKFVAEIAKQRGRMSVRDIMTTYGDLVTEITPCVLVSPDSVARFFPARGGLFDIVVFDEASQVRVADAVGAMGRATSVVVVGDSKQMPPTSFAESTIDDDDDETQFEDVLSRDEESILAECKQARIESRWLSWHYRSQDESLIAFSNRNYYDDRLTSFPAPGRGPADDGSSTARGISLRRVDGTFLRSGPSKTLRTNQVEADAIVEETLRRFDADETVVPSLGIVTFNAQQRTLIESMLRDTGDERVIDALDTSSDGLFVKNLENVQGDERDTILFSTAFSANAKGVLPLNFGPLTNFGGERRLNVAITRARRQVIIFSSFDPGDLRTEETTSRGIRDLRAYLELAQRGAEATLVSTSASRVTDFHREDVADALRERGVEVRTDVGLSDFKVDLVLARAGRLDSPTTAVLLDGPGWAARSTVADRDALPVEVLGGLMEWPAVERVWLPEWLTERESVIARLVATLG